MKKSLSLTLFGFLFIAAFAENPKPPVTRDCAPATAQIELDINNVRARLLVGGDLWWNGSDGRYIVPKTPPGGPPEVSSLFAGGIWMGGLDPGGNLKMAVSTYGSASGRVDFFPGPLNQFTGLTEASICQNWDRHFKVNKTDIEIHLGLFGSPNYTADQIPNSIKGWPANGNPYFFEVHGFDLPNTGQGLAGYWDENADGIYDPLDGDFPILQIKDCTHNFSSGAVEQLPDQMVFWIFNDVGNLHGSNSDPIQMESQVAAFAYQTDDAIDNMTFYRYKNINRAVEDLNNFHMGLWTDPDLGCFTDDYVGVDSTRSLSFVYNTDAVDGDFGCSCPQGINTYCQEIPVVGVDIFRGIDGGEMTSFSTFFNPAFGGPPGTTSPNSPIEAFHLLDGKWGDGSSFQFGGLGYNTGGRSTSYMFSSAPDCAQPDCWSMCTANLPQLDSRMMHSTGGTVMRPGSVTELIFGVIWTPNVTHPCPDLTPFYADDDLAQALFDNCFSVTATTSTDDPLHPDFRQMTLYPNPGNIFEGVTITNVSAKADIKVFDATGKLIDLIEGNPSAGDITQTIYWQPQIKATGLYLIQVVEEGEILKTFKWIGE